MFPINPTYLLLVGLPLVVVLGWFLLNRHRGAVLDRINRNRRRSSEVVGRAVFVDGSRHIPVAVALDPTLFFYENDSMKGALERKWIHEVEYEDELTTGQAIGHGTVMRIRSFSQAFEFVLDGDSAAAWKKVLPAHQTGASETK